VMPPTKVSAVMLPLLVLCDMNAIYIHRKNVVWRKVFEIYLPSILGIVLGALVWWKIGADDMKRFEVPLKQFVGVIAIVFALYLVGKEAAMAWLEQYRPGMKTACVAGVAAGFTSTIEHAAGPIVGLYLYAQSLGKTLFIGTVAWTFTLINLTKLPFYFGVGLIHTDVLLFDLVLVPLIPVGSLMGKYMSHRVSERWFNRIILVLTLVAGIQLVSGINLIHVVLKALVGGE